MTIKDVLVYVDNDENCANRIETTAKMCQHFDAHLTGLYAVRLLNVHHYPYAYIPAAAFEALDEHATEQQDEAKAIFIKNSVVGEISSEFRTVKGEVVGPLGIQSRYADLIVIPSHHINRFKIESTILSLRYFAQSCLPCLGITRRRCAAHISTRTCDGSLGWESRVRTCSKVSSAHTGRSERSGCRIGFIRQNASRRYRAAYFTARNHDQGSFN